MGQLNYTTEKTNELLEKVNDMPETVTDGKTPVLETGTTTTLDPGQNATSEVVANGTDDEGNPKYKLNFGIPKGYDGAGGSGGGGTADSVQWANVLNKPSWVNSSTKPTYTASEVGALPSDTQIPSKTSQLTNDSGFTTSASFKTVNGQSIVGSGNIVIEGGGGDTPSGDGGNVNVTNGSALQSANYYAFKPSADGSLDGTFNVIPNASGAVSGLMSKENYSKLDDMKQVWKIPVAVLELTDNSTSDEIVTAFGLESTVLQAYVVYSASAITNSEYSNTVPLKCFIGNRECLMSGSMADNAYTLDFNYVDSGKLKVISITYDSSARQFSCKLSESGGGTADDTYWLPYNVFNLTENSTKEEVFTMFGGEEEFKSLWTTNRNKKFYIPYGATGENVNRDQFAMSAPATVRAIFPFGYQLDIISIIPSILLSQRNIIRELTIIFTLGFNEISTFYNKTIYPEGYELKPEVYTLTSSSSSEDISTAVGGGSGLKNIIQAIKDGNRLVIRGTNDSLEGMKINQDLICNGYEELGNGDINLIISGIGYGLFGGFAGSLSISYTKSSNTFSCVYAPIS